ncbi:hypothetical protein ACE1ET_20470 [Saccharicrinis sp. FJH62]|uniref:hypothetical protein n=1 Tax=Saccharicrinis sp. FJH62 TaxID=3344657 RepID=UPI0035D46219
MDEEIDIKKSIEKERVIYSSKWFHLFLDKLIYLLIFLAFLISYLSIILIIEPFSLINNSWVYFFPAIFIFGLVTILGFKTDKLRRIIGINKELNKQLIIETINDLEWEIVINNQDFIIIVPSYDYLINGGHQITIIHDQNDILINSVAYAFGGGVSPIHVLSNKSLIRKFSKRFIRKIETTKPNTRS